MPSRPDPRRWALFLGGAVLMLAVALWRRDLFLQALSVTLAQLQRGGLARVKLLIEAGLFAGILLYTLRVIPERADLRKDALRVALGFAAGYLAEAWGTRLGLWRYYTRETPPLWIVPAWPLGALVIERTAARWAPALSRLPAAAGRGLHALAILLVLSTFLLMAGPAIGHPATWAALAVVFWALFWRISARDLPVLAAGAFCVLFADTWGTTNNCWRYWLQRPYGTWGLAAGVGFGVCFDTAVVLGCLKAAEGLDGMGQRS
ncbi:MAG: hypothetical protein HY928_11450 [Elusimicrobia bacterium]|nr:hypothetical protein [Elusimicrobiota bacterium]